MPFVGKKEGGSACGKATKGAAEEEAGVPCKGKSVGRRKKVEESRRKCGGVPYKRKCTARSGKEKFIGDAEEEG